MRLRRHTPTRTPASIPTHSRTLRATAGLPCAALLLAATLTGAAPAQDQHRDGERSAAVASENRPPPTAAATGEVSPVLPLGAGMTLIGLGLALTAVGLRRP
ncbi:hypothetical protein DB35_02655 [Streptomyces abyssalis]|uniref:Gram-positive cocci surface proteins LPxTG domain-containing protein n=1 Tax=Streptomyces abyssalis TaxID=933944 RepID=A0A1E7JPP6_9ACTN|nr:hypothetical protein [Streptomyces abyssalis]OEU90215.1 hypothetical protein AN215_11800 [Streptomyces abyssalis]OEU94949.1 hypothetical protein DB35_02655 [Streptomyces abyssalis]OEV29664.1 hypothetical protein AN219_15315 [Streptomyces nanshensis]